LALSSRNTYLSAAEYAIATKLNGVLFKIAADIREGMPWHDALAEGRFALDTAGFDSVDYLEVRDAASLAVPPHGQRDHLRVLAAVRIGKTRLIDNVGLAP
jgi:pantoate--beta-alanine ligase